MDTQRGNPGGPHFPGKENRVLDASAVHLPPPRQPLQQIFGGGPESSEWMFKPYPAPEYHHQVHAMPQPGSAINGKHHHLQLQTPAQPQQLLTPQTSHKRDADSDLVDDGRKPPYSYAMLIGMAILRSPNQRLTLSQIYQWINDSFSHYRNSSNGWQNSIRHNLSLSKAFTKQHRPKNDPGKGNYWVIAPGYEAQFIKPLKKARSGEQVPLSSGSSNTQFSHPQIQVILPPPPVPDTPAGGSDSFRSSGELGGEPSASSDSSKDEDEDREPHKNKRRALSPLPPSKRLITEVPSLQPPPTVWMPQINHVAPVAWDETSPIRASPSQSLDVHRRYITQLCTPSFELTESPLREEMQFLLPSPQTFPDARRRLFCEKAPLQPQLAGSTAGPGGHAGQGPVHGLSHDYTQHLQPPPFEGEHLHDLFTVARGHDSVFTPIRRPFDTPIRDQSYVFSPLKTPYGNSGSPRRH